MAGRLLPVGGRQEVGDGDHRRRAARLRGRPHDRQPQGLPGRRGPEPLRRVPARAARAVVPRTVALWLLRIGLIVAFVLAHPRRLQPHGDEPPGPAPSTSRPATTWPPTSPSRTMRWTGIIVPCSSSSTCSTSPGAPPTPTSCAAIRTTTSWPASSGRVALVYVIANVAARHPPLPRRVVDVPEPRDQQPRFNNWRAVRPGDRRCHRHRQRELPARSPWIAGAEARSPHRGLPARQELADERAPASTPSKTSARSRL